MAATIPKKVQEERWAKLEKPTVKPPPPKPRVLEPEHEVGLDELPRGPKTVAKAVAEVWEVRWLRVLAEELDEPKRGGESWGIAFRHPDGRYGWASWNSRTGFGGGFLYDPSDRERVLKQRVNETKVKLIPLPLALKAKELKEVLAHG